MSLLVDIEHGRGVFDLAARFQADAVSTGLFGPSGAGKTTLLHLIAGLERPRRGRIVLEGRVLVDTEAGVFVPAHKRRVGVVFQDSRLFPHRSVMGNLRYGLRRTPRRLRRIDLDAVVGLLDLEPLLHRRPTSLSGGERQRVAIGRSLLASPDLLLLDEPVSALDAGRKTELLPMLSGVCRQLDVRTIVVSHQLPELLTLTQRLVLLRDGRCLGEGALTELIDLPEARGVLRGPGLANTWTMNVACRCAEEGMTHLVPAGGPGRFEGRPVVLRGPWWPDAPVGAEVTVQLAADEVAVAMAPVEQISMQNRLPGRIGRLIPDGERCLAVVNAGIELLVELTGQAVREMDLQPGRRVWCLFKTRCLRAVGGPAGTAGRGQPDGPLRAGDGGKAGSPRRIPMTDRHLCSPGG